MDRDCAIRHASSFRPAGIDGIGFGEHTLVVALGIDTTGKKHALAIREGSTEDATLCRSLLADVVARGVPAGCAVLFVIDSSTGLRSAITSVFGNHALVQRCQVHKKRNVLDHLPEHARPHVRAALQPALTNVIPYATAHPATPWSQRGTITHRGSRDLVRRGSGVAGA